MTTVPDSAGTQATPQEIYALARQAGFTGMNAITATAIAMAESGGVTNNLNPGTTQTPEYSIGLWQINYNAHRDFGTPLDLTNPATNAAAAAILFNRSGWQPWSVYTNGSYRNNLPAAGAAAVEVDFGAVVSGLLARIGLPASGGAGTAPGSPSNLVPPASSVTGNQGVNPCDRAAPVLGSQALGTLLCNLSGAASLLTSHGFWWSVLLFGAGLAAVLAGLLLYFKAPQISVKPGPKLAL